MNRFVFRSQSSPPGSRAAFLLFVLLFALSLRLLASAVLHDELLNPYSPLLYQAGTLSFNYVEFGAVRRGLASTLVYFLSPNRLLGTALFHVISAAALSATAAWIFGGIRARPLQLAIFVTLIVSLTRRWAQDAGRTDMAVATLVAIAALCVVNGRVATAGALVTMGVFVHETSVIFGVPLLAALLFDQQRYKQLTPRAWQGFAAAVAGPMLIYASLRWLPRADHATIVETVRHSLPTHKYVDWAIYFAMSESRGVATAICQNLTNPNYPLHVASGVLLIGLFAFALAGTGRVSALALLAGLPPLLFLATVANDMSRWTVLGAFNVWLLCACRAQQPSAEVAESPRLRAALALAMLVLLAESQRFPVSHGIYTPSPIIEHWADRLDGLRTPDLDEAFARCDPGWRNFLDAAESSPPR